MSKQNNLKDYLIDLYDGISSKKPDASRNPQRFRAEIEAIRTGGIPWDGDYTIDGEALPEHPKAYYATSVDELPTDAVDGSLAVVEDNNLVGVWLLNEELTVFAEGEDPVTVYVDFYCLEQPEIQYSLIYCSGSYPYFEYSDNENWDLNPYDDGWRICNDGGNLPDHYIGRTICITKDPTDEIFRNWLPLNGKRIRGGYTLYSRENGEWVKQEIGGDSAEPNLIEQTFTENGEYPASDEGADGYSNVIVDVPIPEMPTIIEAPNELTENRTYTASEFGADGISEFTVNVSGDSVDYLVQFVEGTLTEYENDEITSIRRSAFGFMVNLKSVKLPNLTSISQDSFNNCISLEAVYAPLITSISFQSFYNCRSLETVDFPNLSSIDTSCFSNCEKLKKIDLGISPSVPPQSMRYCNSLETVILRSQILVRMSNTNALDSTPIASGTGYIYVPRDLVESYKTATNWSTYADQIRAIEDYPEITGG